jgi:hypothetical protein
LYSASRGTTAPVTSLRAVQRRALGLLFAVITLAFALIAVASAEAGRWPIALAALVLGGWMATLAVKGLRPR